MADTDRPSRGRLTPAQTPDRRAAVEGVVRWATDRGRASIAGLLVWFVPLVIGPATGAASASDPWPAWGGLVLASACWFFAVAAAYLIEVPRWAGPAALAVVGLVAISGVLSSGLAWTPLFLLLSIGIGATVRAGWAPWAIVTVTLVASGAAWRCAGTWDATWTTALPTFLSGLSTYWFCVLLAVISELVRTRDELAEVAVTEERMRFSRDLHDLLGHTLSVIVVKAEVVRRLSQSPTADPAVVAAHAADIEDIGRQALVEVRQAATSYRGLTLDGELRRAVLALEAAGIDLSVVPAATPLPGPIDELFGWVVREAVTNVIRHSDGRHVAVRITEDRGVAGIEISDDGTRAAATSPGHGLRGLEERAGAAGGALRLEPTDRGLTLRVRAPLSEPAVPR